MIVIQHHCREFGFTYHRAMGEYMESKQLFWNSETKNYDLKVGTAQDEETAEMSAMRDVIFQPLGESDKVLENLESYLPLLNLLLQNKDRLVTLLMPQSDGMIPRYAVPGKCNSQSIYMSAALFRLVKEYCDSRNLKQRDVIDIALIEFFKRYGYQREVDKLLHVTWGRFCCHFFNYKKSLKNS